MTSAKEMILLDHPNSARNVFLMMRFRQTEYHEKILDNVRKAFDDYGLTVVRADDKNYAASLWDNVKAYIEACDLGVVIFEQIDEQDFNPNVSIELGYMLAKDKAVLLLKEQRLKVMPSDVVGMLYKSFDVLKLDTVKSAVHTWLRDLGIAKSRGEKMLLFISSGGTCRCAMAKAITQQAFAGRTMPFNMRVESMAYKYGNAYRASRGARRAVFNGYGADLLAEHRVTRRSDGVVADADLILVMDQNLKSEFPADRTYGFNEFFGLSGSVPDPWPDSEDPPAHERYRNCFEHLRKVIEDNREALLTRLGKAK